MHEYAPGLRPFPAFPLVYQSRSLLFSDLAETSRVYKKDGLAAARLEIITLIQKFQIKALVLKIAVFSASSIICRELKIIMRLSQLLTAAQYAQAVTGMDGDCYLSIDGKPINENETEIVIDHVNGFNESVVQSFRYSVSSEDYTRFENHHNSLIDSFEKGTLVSTCGKKREGI